MMTTRSAVPFLAAALACTAACSGGALSERPPASGTGGSGLGGSESGSGGGSSPSTGPGGSTSSSASSGTAGGPPSTHPLDAWEALFQKGFGVITDASGYYDGITTAAFQCVGAANGYRRWKQGAAFDPTFAAKLLAAVKAAGDYLKVQAQPYQNSGWGTVPSFKPFGNTVPADTVFAYQTSISLWCLAEAASVTGDASYRDLATAAKTRYIQHGLVQPNQGHPLDCGSCGYFWYDLSTVDVGRYVKNTNALMALAVLAYDRYGADSASHDAGGRAITSEFLELADDGASGYYTGHDDPAYPGGGQPWDGHVVYEIFSLYHAGQIFDRQDFRDQAHAYYGLYKQHGASASEKAAAACHMVREYPDVAADCTAYAMNGDAGWATFGLVVDYSKPPGP